MIRLSNKEQIYQTLVELWSRGQLATREVIRKETSLRLSVVDDNLRTLIEEERVRRPSPGIFEPVYVYEERTITASIVMPSGRCKLEVGDNILDLSPRETRNVMRLLYGWLHDFGRDGQRF